MLEVLGPRLTQAKNREFRLKQEKKMSKIDSILPDPKPTTSKME